MRRRQFIEQVFGNVGMSQDVRQYMYREPAVVRNVPSGPGPLASVKTYFSLLSDDTLPLAKIDLTRGPALLDGVEGYFVMTDIPDERGSGLLWSRAALLWSLFSGVGSFAAGRQVAPEADTAISFLRWPADRTKGSMIVRAGDRVELMLGSGDVATMGAGAVERIPVGMAICGVAFWRPCGQLVDEDRQRAVFGGEPVRDQAKNRSWLDGERRIVVD